MATIHDVAREAGVSSATVSHVINNSRAVSAGTREKVMRAIEALRYRRDGIARSLRRNSTGTIGLIVSDISNPFFADLVRGLEDAVYAHGEHGNLVLCNTDENVEKERRYLDVLIEKRIAGLVMVPAGGNESYLNELLAGGLPIVFADRWLDAVNADAVVVNNRAASREIVGILCGNGYRRIAVLKAQLRANAIEDRVLGYADALKAARIARRPEYVMTSRSTVEDAARAGLHLLNLPTPPAAVFCTNNFMTLGLMHALAECGLRCPEDMAVVGFDDFPWAASFQPRLTVVAQPGYALGQTAASLLFDRMRKGFGGPPERRVLPTTILVRDSCGSRPRRA